MSNDRDPYSRHYWKLVDDQKFEEIFDDDHHYATWGRLLMIADQAWPASAHLPASARKSSVAKLAEVKLIEILPGGRFRMVGTQAEREKRSQQAKDAAAARWGIADGNAASNADSNADASVPGMPSKAKQSSTEQSKAGQPVRAPDPADAYWSMTGRYPVGKSLNWIDELTAEFGPEAVIRALATTYAQDSSTATLLGRTQNLLRHEARTLSLQAQAATKAHLQEKRSAPREMVDPAALEAEIQKILRGEAA